MTVSELHEELSRLIVGGCGDLNITADCRFEINEKLYNLCMYNLEKVYYQNGNIELNFNEITKKR